MYVGQTGRGWGSAGKEMFGFRRISWDGKTMPVEMKTIRLTKSGFRIQFTQPIAAESFENPDNVVVESWEYKYQPEYGSPKVDNKRLPVDIRVSKANPSVVNVSLPLETERVYKFTLNNIRSESDKPLTNNIGYYTLNRLKK